MGRRWKLALGVAIVLAIGFWDFGLPNIKSSAPAAAVRPAAPAASPSASSTPVVPDIPGVLHPAGAPEFTAAFTSGTLDTSVWDTCYPWLSQSGCNNFGNSFESEWYLPSQVRVYNDGLHLIAKREPTAGTTPAGAPKEFNCRSGMVTSHPGFNFEYGYVQVVARMPSSPGLWSAFWLAASSYQWPPEMDMIENWGDGTFAGSFFHPYPHSVPSDKGLIQPAVRATGWHTFGLSWTKHEMVFLMDGKVTLIVTHRVPRMKMYLIADVADNMPVGGTNQCSGQMIIRSVKVWQA
jgi:beta-glucanase (GH16 family)